MHQFFKCTCVDDMEAQLIHWNGECAARKLMSIYRALIISQRRSFL